MSKISAMGLFKLPKPSFYTILSIIVINLKSKLGAKKHES